MSEQSERVGLAAGVQLPLAREEEEEEGDKPLRHDSCIVKKRHICTSTVLICTPRPVGEARLVCTTTETALLLPQCARLVCGGLV